MVVCIHCCQGSRKLADIVTESGVRHAEQFFLLLFSYRHYWLARYPRAHRSSFSFVFLPMLSKYAASLCISLSIDVVYKTSNYFLFLPLHGSIVHTVING